MKIKIKPILIKLFFGKFSKNISWTNNCNVYKALIMSSVKSHLTRVDWKFHYIINSHIWKVCIYTCIHIHIWIWIIKGTIEEKVWTSKKLENIHLILHLINKTFVNEWFDFDQFVVNANTISVGIRIVWFFNVIFAFWSLKSIQKLLIWSKNVR